MSRKDIHIIDTSILMHLLNIDDSSRDYDLKVRQRIKEEFQVLTSKPIQDELILPITSIIETGNHIAHIPNASERRKAAIKFQEMLVKTCQNETPWIFYGVNLKESDLLAISRDYVNEATSGKGLGDLTTIQIYHRFIHDHRDRIHNIRIWSIDEHLQGYIEENIQPIHQRRNRRM